MPNLLLVITGVCIIAYVVRETLYELQKKMNDIAVMIVPISRANHP